MRFLTFILAFVFLLGISENAKAENESSGNATWHDIVSASSSQNKAEKKRKFQKAVMLANDMSRGQDITFEQVMKDPDNINLNMAYAKTQIRQGDIKGASATLERMLRINPRLEEVRLLYAAILFRLDNISESKTQLSKIDISRLPSKSLQEKQMLETMIARREKKVNITAHLSAGITYDTNRNSFPEDDTIVYPSGAELKFDGSEKDDMSYTALAAFDIERKTGSYGQNSIFAGASYYLSQQDKLQGLDMGIFSGKAGMRFTGRKTMITPQLLYSGLKLDGNNYLAAAGGSLRIDQAISRKSLLYAEGKYLHQDYQNTPSNNKNDYRSGSTAGTMIGLRNIISPKASFETELSGLMKDADKDYYSSISFGLALRHFTLLGKSTYLMTQAQGTTENYKGKDTSMLGQFVSMGKKRKDNVIRASMLFGFPIYKSLTGNLQYEFYHSNSNIQIYTYTNHKLATMLNWRFAL